MGSGRSLCLSRFSGGSVRFLPGQDGTQKLFFLQRPFYLTFSAEGHIDGGGFCLAADGFGGVKDDVRKGGVFRQGIRQFRVLRKRLYVQPGVEKAFRFSGKGAPFKGKAGDGTIFMKPGIRLRFGGSDGQKIQERTAFFENLAGLVGVLHRYLPAVV